MASRTYENFDLLLEAEDGGVFRARVTKSPLDECPSARFVLPFDPTQLENLLLKLDPGRSGTRRAGADPQSQASLDLGGRLFEAVFSDELLLAWSRSQDAARADGNGLRLRLRLTDAPSIAGLPWELLYDRRTNSFIAQSERTPVVRYLEVPQPPRPLAVDGALKILVVISSPTDLPELDVEAEWRRVQDALEPRIQQGTVKLDRLPAPTISALSTWLRRNDVHILHFIGHGDYDPQIQDGVIFFTDRYGRSSKVSPSILGPYLRDHDPLRLVLLNACQSARVDATDPFSGMAQGLVQQDCTAVVAMQFPISDGAATAFTGEFYGALADGLPIDQAATSGRKALLADYAAEWATPVLFLRSKDGQVFDHIVPQPDVTTTPTPSPALEEVADTPTAALPPPATTAPADPAEVEAFADATAPEVDAATETHTDPIEKQPVTEPFEPVSLIGPGRAYQPPTDPSPSRRGPNRRLLVASGAVVALVVVVALAWYGFSRAKSASVSTLTGPVIAASRLTTRLSMDGDPADWTLGLPTVSSDKLVAGDTATVRATWTLTWNDSHLYLLADVTDPVLTQVHGGTPSELFKGDGISFEFGTATPQNANRALEVGDRHVLLGPSPEGKLFSAVNVASGRGFAPGNGPIAGLEGAMRTTDHGYVIEAAIPWSTLGFSDIRPGVEIGMNLNVSDASPDAPSQLRDMVSNNLARKGNDAQFRSIWGTLTLQG